MQETEAGHALADTSLLCHRLCCCMIHIWPAGAAARAGGRPSGPREHLLRQVDAAALLAGSALHSRTAAWQTAVKILSRAVLPSLVETRVIDLKSQSRVHCTCVAFRHARDAARSAFNQYVASATLDDGQPIDDTRPRP